MSVLLFYASGMCYVKKINHYVKTEDPVAVLQYRYFGKIELVLQEVTGYVMI